VTAPPAGDRELVERFRDRLDALGYTADGIRAALGTTDEVLSRARDIPVHVRRLRGAGALGTIIRLLVLDLPVRRDELATAIAPLPVALLGELGLVRPDGEDIVPLTRIVPHDDLLIASDRRLSPGEHAPHDHVPGVNRPSVTLAHLTVRSPVPSALDLGTGCGVEALLLARHAERVVATDISARAVAYASFNALLNRVSNVELRIGSWSEPVRGERFHTVACNPPYVISPETTYVYRDSGRPGHAVSEQVVRQVPAHLVEGGFASLMLSWVVTDPEDAAAPVRGWLEGSDCDAWILHYRTEDPLTTARSWNEADAIDPVAYGETLDRWLSYYASHGIEAIAYGTAILRRRAAARNWIRVDELPSGRLQPASAHILRVFAAQDHLAAIADESLLGEHLELVDRHHVEQRLHIGHGPSVGSLELALDEGLGFQAAIDPLTLALLEKLRGRTVRAALTDVAQANGIAGERLASFLRSGLSTVRRMYAAGMLERGVTPH